MIVHDYDCIFLADRTAIGIIVSSVCPSYCTVHRSYTVRSAITATAELLVFSLHLFGTTSGYFRHNRTCMWSVSICAAVTGKQTMELHDCPRLRFCWQILCSLQSFSIILYCIVKLNSLLIIWNHVRYVCRLLMRHKMNWMYTGKPI